MPEDKSVLHNLVGYSKDASVLLRELCIVALCCLLFFKPCTLKTLLKNAGINTVPTPLGNINVDDIANAGSGVANISQGLSDGLALLQEIQSGKAAVPNKEALQNLSASLQTLQQQAQSTDESLKSTIAKQQAQAAQSFPQAAKQPGWLFAGHVDDTKTQWSGEGAKNVPATLPPQFTMSQKFSVASTAYLREDAPSGGHFGGKVISVVPANQQVQVVGGPDYSHAIAGGYFVWLKVQPL